MILLQNEDWFLSGGYLKGKIHHYKMKIGFIIKLLEGDTPPLQNEDCVLSVFIIRLLEGNTSEGQLPLLQNEIGFLHVVFRWATSLATK